MPPKKTFFAFLIIAAALIILGAFIGIAVVIVRKANPAAPSEYSAVYLTTGDIYFGRLDWFPWPRIKNAWVLQRPAAAGGQFTVAPLNTAFWKPVDEIYLNPNQIVLWTRLRQDSGLLNYFNNPSLLGQGPPLATSTAPAPILNK